MNKPIMTEDHLVAIILHHHQKDRAVVLVKCLQIVVNKLIYPDNQAIIMIKSLLQDNLHPLICIINLQIIHNKKEYNQSLHLKNNQVLLASQIYWLALVRVMINLKRKILVLVDQTNLLIAFLREEEELVRDIIKRVIETLLRNSMQSD